jgi:hypothetical protein
MWGDGVEGKKGCMGVGIRPVDGVWLWGLGGKSIMSCFSLRGRTGILKGDGGERARCRCAGSMVSIIISSPSERSAYGSEMKEAGDGTE